MTYGTTHYIPRLVIGIEHTKKAIEPVIHFLEDKVHEGTKVGTEAYDYPLTHQRDHWSKMDSEFPEFYITSGDFVKSKRGLYIPLQRYDHFKDHYRYVFDEE